MTLSGITAPGASKRQPQWILSHPPQARSNQGNSSKDGQTWQSAQMTYRPIRAISDQEGPSLQSQNSPLENVLHKPLQF